MEQRGFLAKNEVKKISVEEQKDWRVPEEKGGGGRVRERLAGEGKLYFLSGMGGVAGSLCFFDEGGTLRLIFCHNSLWKLGPIDLRKFGDTCGFQCSVEFFVVHIEMIIVYSSFLTIAKGNSFEVFFALDSRAVDVVFGRAIKPDKD